MKFFIKLILIVIVTIAIFLSINLFRGGRFCIGDATIASHCLISE